MSQRWYVSKDGAQLGPYTAADVRELLRSGALDPFDLIWQEGSQVKRELVEVDVIFQAEGIEYADGLREPSQADFDATQIATLSLDDDSPSSRPPEPLDPRGEMPTLTLDDEFAAPLLAQGDGRRRGPIARAEPEAAVRHHQRPEEQRIVVPEYTRPHGDEQRVRPRRSKRRQQESGSDQQKKYFIVDRTDRLLGPLSAKEIQSLFFKGVLDRSVKVLKTGTNKRIPITKFVSVYARKSLKEAMAVGQAGLVGGLAGLPRSPVLQQMAIARYAQAQERERLWPWIIGGVIIGMLLLAAVVLSHRYDEGQWPFDGADSLESLEGTRQQKRRNTLPPKSIKPPKVARPPSGRLPRGGERPTVQRPKREVTAPAPAVRATPRPRVEPRQVRPVERRTPPPVVRELPPRRPVQRVRPRATPRPIVTRPAPVVRAPVATPRPVPVRPAPTQAPPARPAGPSVAQLQNGQTVTLAGMSYNKAEIQACPDDAVCAVSFSGPGGTITGRFFKGTFGQKLLQMPGRATISGRVTKVGAAVSILVVGVR